MELSSPSSTKQNANDSTCINDDLAPSTSCATNVEGPADRVANTTEDYPIPPGSCDGTSLASSRLTRDFQSTRDAMRQTMEYLMMVKLRFAFRDDLYQEFLSVLKVVHQPPIDQDQLSQRIADLFQGSPDLLCGLQNFIPREVIDLDTVIIGERIKSMDIAEAVETEPMEVVNTATGVLNSS